MSEQALRRQRRRRRAGGAGAADGWLRAAGHRIACSVAARPLGDVRARCAPARAVPFGRRSVFDALQFEPDAIRRMKVVTGTGRPRMQA
jgi:hypothetical protein